MLWLAGFHPFRSMAASPPLLPLHPPAPPPEVAEAAAREAARQAAQLVAEALWPEGCPQDLTHAAGHASGLCLKALGEANLRAQFAGPRWPSWAEAAFGLAWPWQPPAEARWTLQGGSQASLNAQWDDGQEAGLSEALPPQGPDLSPWRQALLSAKAPLGGKLPLEGGAALAANLPEVAGGPDLNASWGPAESEAEAKLASARAARARALSEAEEAEANRPAPAPEGWRGWWRRWRDRPKHQAAEAAKRQLAAAEEGLMQAEGRAHLARQGVVERALRLGAQSESEARQSAFRRRLGELTEAAPQRLFVQGLLPQWPAHLLLGGGPLPPDERPLVWLLDAGALPEAPQALDTDAPWLVGPGGDALLLAQSLDREVGQVWVAPSLAPHAWAWLARLAAGAGHVRRARRAAHAAEAATQKALGLATEAGQAAWVKAAEAGLAPKPEPLDPMAYRIWVQEAFGQAEESVATVRGAGEALLLGAPNAEDLVRAVEGLAQADSGDLAAVARDALLNLARQAARACEGHLARRAAALEDRVQAARVAAEAAWSADQAPATPSTPRPPQPPPLGVPSEDALALVDAVATATRPVEASWLEALGRAVAQVPGGLAAAKADARHQRDQRLQAGETALKGMLHAQAEGWSKLVAEGVAAAEPGLLAWHEARMMALEAAFLAAHHAAGPGPSLEALAQKLEGQVAELAAAEAGVRATARALGAQVG